MLLTLADCSLEIRKVVKKTSDNGRCLLTRKAGTLKMVKE